MIHNCFYVVETLHFFFNSNLSYQTINRKGTKLGNITSKLS